jgi:hypothetical protein
VAIMLKPESWIMIRFNLIGSRSSSSTHQSVHGRSLKELNIYFG